MAAPTIRVPGRALEPWPSLPLRVWEPTRDTLHMWAQIAGKVRMTLSPKINHCWEVPFYLSARGFTTSPIPWQNGCFEVRFDFIDHVLVIETSEGAQKKLALRPQCVADFYSEFMDALHSLNIGVKIWPMPVEIPNPIRFDQDRVHCAYDPEYATRFWRVLLSADTVLKEFRSRFIGKHSPVHFFWGSFDLASTRFSGRRAPERPEADAFTREAYSHEVISHGFWPGSGAVDAVFYAYSAPEPEGFSSAQIRPPQAFYSADFKEYFLKYEDLRAAPSPRQALLDFCQSTYEAGATLARWDRSALERPASHSSAGPDPR